MKNKTIQKISKEVIQYEIDALRNLKGKINDSFVRIVNLILSSLLSFSNPISLLSLR